MGGLLLYSDIVGQGLVGCCYSQIVGQGWVGCCSWPRMGGLL